MKNAIFFTALAVPALVAAAGFTDWRTTTVAGDLKMGYQLVVADLNRDGRPDFIVVDEKSTELAWYENPGWQRHVLAREVPRTINLDVFDYDGCGTPEIAMGYHFETEPKRSIGNVAILKAGKDPREPWAMTEIDRVPTVHRVRWIDWGGKRLLLVAPMIGERAVAPAYADQVPVYAYDPGTWKRTVLTSAALGILHSIAPVKWQGPGEQLMTADFQGIRVYTPAGMKEIAKGDPRPCPQCGSSEIKLGKLGKKRFIAAIEPWHGNQVVVYSEAGKTWKRQVIEDGMTNGHALAVGDLDGDGKDEIVAGFRGKGFKLYVFKLEGSRWTRHVLDDGGIAAADCKIGDFSGGGRMEVLCSGASTGNVKLYRP